MRQVFGCWASGENPRTQATTEIYHRLHCISLHSLDVGNKREEKFSRFAVSKNQSPPKLASPDQYSSSSASSASPRSIAPRSSSFLRTDALWSSPSDIIVREAPVFGLFSRHFYPPFSQGGKEESTTPPLLSEEGGGLLQRSVRTSAPGFFLDDTSSSR